MHSVTCGVSGFSPLASEIEPVAVYIIGEHALGQSVGDALPAGLPLVQPQERAAEHGQSAGNADLKGVAPTPMVGRRHDLGKPWVERPPLLALAREDDPAKAPLIGEVMFPEMGSLARLARGQSQDVEGVGVAICNCSGLVGTELGRSTSPLIGSFQISSGGYPRVFRVELHQYSVLDRYIPRRLSPNRNFMESLTQ